MSCSANCSEQQIHVALVQTVATKLKQISSEYPPLSADSVVFMPNGQSAIRFYHRAEFLCNKSLWEVGKFVGFSCKGWIVERRPCFEASDHLVSATGMFLGNSALSC